MTAFGTQILLAPLSFPISWNEIPQEGERIDPR